MCHVSAGEGLCLNPIIQYAFDLLLGENYPDLFVTNIQH